MTDLIAEDKPEPPPRQIEWLSFSGVSELNHVEAEVRVAVSGGLDPYRAETLHVMARRSPAGPSYVQYLTNRGTWNSVHAGTEVPDSGFEMPPGFSEALKNAFQGELKKAKQDAVDALEAAEAIVETYKKVAALCTTAAESCVKRVEQLERQVDALMAELQDWRNGDIVHEGTAR